MATDSMTPMSQSLTDALDALSRVWTPLQWMTPLNLDDLQRELTSILQDPTGTHARLVPVYREIDFSRVRQHLDLLPPLITSAPESLQDLLEADMTSRLALLSALRDRNDDALSSWARKRTGLPSPETIAEATKTLQDTSCTPFENLTVSARELKTRIQTALNGYHLTNWNVVIQPAMAAKASVIGSQNLIRISERCLVSETEAKRLIAHEIGGHVLRWENARRQPLTLAAHPLGVTAPTEEGLAALTEEQLDVSTPDTRRTYALRALAVELARTHGILELALELVNYGPISTAAQLALRIKRGLTQMEAPGGLTKDHGYLSGLRATRRYLSEPVALSLLRGTKWPLELLRESRELASSGCLVPAELLPSREALAIA